jgi:hypothetical protein
MSEVQPNWALKRTAFSCRLPLFVSKFLNTQKKRYFSLCLAVTAVQGITLSEIAQTSIVVLFATSLGTTHKHVLKHAVAVFAMVEDMMQGTVQ